MSHIAVSGLAYAHPGGELLFSDVSFRIGPGEHIGLVGANGVGKSTLMRILAGVLTGEAGDANLGGIIGYMAQDVGAAGDPRTVRELLLSLAPSAVREAGQRVIAEERALADGDALAGMRLGTAIADFSALGGYELEGQWDATCRPSSRSSARCGPARRRC
jgi:ATPase subunit of ABC transporter with duplicated ATPase domains